MPALLTVNHLVGDPKIEEVYSTISAVLLKQIYFAVTRLVFGLIRAPLAD